MVSGWRRWRWVGVRGCDAEGMSEGRCVLDRLHSEASDARSDDDRRRDVNENEVFQFGTEVSTVTRLFLGS